MTANASSDHAHDVHPPSYYIKIWFLLLVLLTISVLGPMFEHKVITLITAFGVAGIKAYIVCAYFMHLKIEKPLATMVVAAGLGMMVLFFFGTAADVMHHDGRNWNNYAAKAETKRGLEAAKLQGEHGGHGGGAHHAPAHAEPATHH